MVAQYDRERMKHARVSKRYIAAIIMVIVGLFFNIISFTTPYWYVSWQRIPTPFIRLGLWEACLDGYTDPHDYTAKNYIGCWWYLSPEYYHLRWWLNPSWFVGVQWIMTFSLLSHIAGSFVAIYQFVNASVKSLRIASLFILCNSLLTALGCLVFGTLSRERNWMPRPDLNYLSWSYGFAVCAGFLSFFGAWFFFEASLYLGMNIGEERRLQALAANRAKRPEDVHARGPQHDPLDEPPVTHKPQDRDPYPRKEPYERRGFQPRTDPYRREPPRAYRPPSESSHSDYGHGGGLQTTI